MKQFPIMIGYRGTKGPCPSSIPWDAIAPYDGMAKVNHDQTLERLAERGGLDPVEAFFVMTGRKWSMVPVGDDLEKEACAFLDKIVRDRGELQTKLNTSLLRVSELTEALEACSKILVGAHDGSVILGLRDIVTRGLSGKKQKCGAPGPAGLFCEREPHEDGNHMGDCSKAYPNKPVREKCNRCEDGFKRPPSNEGFVCDPCLTAEAKAVTEKWTADPRSQMEGGAGSLADRIG